MKLIMLTDLANEQDGSSRCQCRTRAASGYRQEFSFYLTARSKSETKNVREK